METDLKLEVLFRLSDGRYLYIEADLPTGWLYTLYGADGVAITGGNVDGLYRAAYGVALEALRQMEIEDVVIDPSCIDLNDLIGGNDYAK